MFIRSSEILPTTNQKDIKTTAKVAVSLNMGTTAKVAVSLNMGTTAKVGCCHHWQLYPATSGNFAGICKLCGLEQDFPDPARPMTQPERRALHLQVTKEVEAAKKANK